MDRTALDGLIAAWRASGDPRVLTLALDAAAEADAAEVAAPLLEALGDLEAPPAEALLAAAKLRLAAGETAGAEAAYQAAVAANPTLEDADLAARIAAAAAPADPEPAKALNVVSLDAARGGRLDVADERPSDWSARAGREASAAARATFADVGGLDAVKDQIRRKIITPFQKPSLFQRFKRKAGGGVLLYGPPGCGKTLLARATAGEVGARFLNVAIAEVLDLYVGESEKRLAGLFAESRRETPSVLFFDELEALAGRREARMGETKASLVSTFLSELDGFESRNEGVLVLAATNTPWAVDPAFRRPGRFDRVIFAPPPDRPARESVLRILLKGRPGAEAIDVAAVAARTGGYSGADLEHLVDTAVDLAIEASLAGGAERPLDMDLMAEALGETKPSTLEWLTTARNYARYSNTGGQYDDVARFLEEHGG